MATDRGDGAGAALRRAALDQGPTDGQLLGRFLTARNEDAFAALVRRHGQSGGHADGKRLPP